MLPLIMSCPRGSNMRPLRIQSYSRRKCCRFSLIVFPSNAGPPLCTRRTGLPQVCASIHWKTETPSCEGNGKLLSNINGDCAMLHYFLLKDFHSADCKNELYCFSTLSNAVFNSANTASC